MDATQPEGLSDSALVRLVDRFLRIDPDMPRKRCIRCGIRKAITDFYDRPKSGSRRFPQQRTTRDGVWSHCKRCQMAAVMRCERNRRARDAALREGER
jgi:hypothetical protein